MKRKSFGDMVLLPPNPHAKVSKVDGALDQKAPKPLSNMVLVGLRQVQSTRQVYTIQKYFNGVLLFRVLELLVEMHCSSIMFLSDQKCQTSDLVAFQSRPKGPKGGEW